MFCIDALPAEGILTEDVADNDNAGNAENNIIIVTSALKAARCKKDVILSLSEEIVLLVCHGVNMHQMIVRA